MSDNNERTQFPMTSETLVDKLQRGEAWERFCKSYYGPIYASFMNLNEKRNGEIPANDVDDAVAWIFDYLKLIFQGKNRKGEAGRATYEYGKGRLRGWLYRIIGNAMHDYWREEYGEGQVKERASLDVPGEDGESREVAESESVFYDIGSDNWVKFLQQAAVKEAMRARVRSETSQNIIGVIIRESHKEATLSDADIASECKSTEANVRKVRERFYKDVRKCFENYRVDDPEFFIEYAKTHGMKADADFALMHF